MAIILPKEQSTAEGFGAGLGQGIGGSLQQLAANKLQQMQQKAQQQQTFDLLRNIPGLSEQGAQLLSSLPPEYTKNFNIGSLLPADFFIKQQEQQLPQAQPTVSQMFQPQQPQQQESSQSANKLQEVMSALSDPVQAAKLIAQTKLGQVQPQSAISEQPTTAQQLQAKAVLKQPQEVKIQEPKSPPSKNAAHLFESSQERQHREKMEFAREKEAIRSDEATKKFYKEELKHYTKAAEESKKNIRDYDLLIKLAERGDINSGRTQQLLSKIGLEGFLDNPTSAIARKTIARQAQNAASAFNTSRLTNFLEQQYMRSLVSMWNTPEGLIAISKINKRIEDTNGIKNDLKKEILKENNGHLPFDWEDQVADRAEPELQKIGHDAQIIAITAGFPSAKKTYAQGSIVRDPDTQMTFKVVGNDYIPLEG